MRRADINLLVRLVEGLGHLGVVTTLDKERGFVLLQTTADCREDLLTLMGHMPVVWRVMDESDMNEIDRDREDRDREDRDSEDVEKEMT
ncbi:MAG: DUF4911 domain-containing protein [Peptococcaceae bacterium]|nr:DUF4911 domain-containing protein [Peptococcaceae bacterium]